jgi:hypothetical protein
MVEDGNGGGSSQATDKGSVLACFCYTTDSEQRVGGKGNNPGLESALLSEWKRIFLPENSLGCRMVC